MPLTLDKVTIIIKYLDNIKTKVWVKNKSLTVYIKLLQINYTTFQDLQWTWILLDLNNKIFDSLNNAFD